MLESLFTSKRYRASSQKLMMVFFATHPEAADVALTKIAKVSASNTALVSMMVKVRLILKLKMGFN